MAKDNPKKILIIHTWGIGDLIMFTPALKVLRENFPEAVIDVLVTYKSQVSEVLQEGKVINKIIKLSWPESSIFKKIKLIWRLRKEKYNWSIVTSWTNPLKGGSLSFLIGSKIRIGSYEKRKAVFYAHQSQRDENRPQVEQNLDMLRSLGLKVTETPGTYFDFSENEKDFAKQFIEKIDGRDKILIGFHPGADETHGYLLWPKEYFIELGKRILKEYPNARLLILGGPDEKELCEELKGRIGEGTFAVNDFSLKQVAALIDDCRVFIASDSGLGHLADATNTHVISIFGPSNPKRSAPRGPKVSVFNGDCRHRYDEKRVHTCLKKITPDMVFGEVKKILEKRS